MKAVMEPSHHIVLAEFDHGTDYLANPDALPQPIKSGTASKFLCIGAPNTSLFQTLIKRGFPVVYLGNEVPISGVTSIVPDFAEASRIAVEYLFKTGHKRIAILSGPFGSTEHQIIELNRGVKSAYDNVGVPIEAQNIIYGDMTFKSGYALMELLLNRKPEPTAIFGFNDAIAAGALTCAQNHGLKVPEQISFVGCSDDAVASYLHPGLTTVHIPAEEMGQIGIREVERRVKEGAVNETNKVLVPVRLIERGSCVAPAS
jgi:DNA-binding LacI/PurR family transcriptional regulator